MSDDLPLDWPTAEQRERVDARARALRARRLGLGAGATALVIALVVGLLVVVNGGSSHSVKTADSAPRINTGPRPLPALESAPEPRGWRLVDFGDARFALPPGWVSAPPTGTSPAPCATTPGDEVRFYLATNADCPTITFASWPGGALPPRPESTIHGFAVFRASDNIMSVTYAVPALNVSITLHDDAGEQVLTTLTSSARRVVLGGGALPKVPDDWKPLTYGGISLAVPPTMPVTRLDPDHLAPGECSAVPFPESGAFVGNGVTGAFNCPLILSGQVPVPTDGVWLHTQNDPQERFGSTVDNDRVHLAIAPVSGYEIAPLTSAIDVGIVGPNGAPSTTIVRIGLGPNPRIARTILASIRLAHPSN